jgi:hypothetical protein
VRGINREFACRRKVTPPFGTQVLKYKGDN